MAKQTEIRFRCTEEFKTQIGKLAALENRTVSNYIENVLKIETLKLVKTEESKMMNTKEVLKKASEIDEFKNTLPTVEVGEIVTLGTIWDGEGSTPDDSYSYQLTDADWINYKFEVIEKNDDELETLVKIIDIELL